MRPINQWCPNHPTQQQQQQHVLPAQIYGQSGLAQGKVQQLHLSFCAFLIWSHTQMFSVRMSPLLSRTKSLTWRTQGPDEDIQQGTFTLVIQGALVQCCSLCLFRTLTLSLDRAFVSAFSRVTSHFRSGPGQMRREGKGWFGQGEVSLWLCSLSSWLSHPVRQVLPWPSYHFLLDLQPRHGLISVACRSGLIISSRAPQVVISTLARASATLVYLIHYSSLCHRKEDQIIFH